MIIFGSGGDNVVVGQLSNQPCEFCGDERPFSVLLNYRYFGFYWVFNCVTERNYWAVCDACQRGMELDEPDLISRLPPAPIPFMRRWGLLVLGIAFAALVLFAALNGDL
ncbi:MAG: hypothetical protein DCC68_16995 [Planctomycetota bacterium]|nr:MAG: hypothetical protein DCC68_16995 [Planctomycetota bacterium]